MHVILIRDSITALLESRMDPIRFSGRSRLVRFLLNVVFFLASVLAIWIFSSSRQTLQPSKNLEDISSLESPHCDLLAPVKRVAIIGQSCVLTNI